MLEQPAQSFEVPEALPSSLVDEASAPPRQQPCAEKFQLPGALWRTVFGCYAFFILALATATGRDTAARFVLVISGLFILVYFFHRDDPRQARQPGQIGHRSRPAARDHLWPAERRRGLGSNADHSRGAGGLRRSNRGGGFTGRGVAHGTSGEAARSG